MTEQQPSTRQTLSYLRNLLDERGIRPKNKLGQNFLIDLNLIDLLVRTAELTREDLVLEVGCGTGSLTTRLTDLAGTVLGVEIDPAFYDMARETIADRDNVEILYGDILKNKNEINPRVIEKIALWREKSGCKKFKLVANLPYAIATPLIANLLLTDLPIDRMVVTVQWEIAERLTAQPGVKEYAALAVMVQSLADVELVRKLGPSVFWPRPKVSSAFVMVRPNAAKRALVGDVQRFRNFLRALYVHRRKNLRGALSGLLPSGRIDKEEVDRRLLELGMPGTIRAESLDIAQHLRLSAAFADQPL